MYYIIPSYICFVQFSIVIYKIFCFLFVQYVTRVSYYMLYKSIKNIVLISNVFCYKKVKLCVCISFKCNIYILIMYIEE